MSRQKGYNPDFDLEVKPSKINSCFNFKKDLAMGKRAESYVNHILHDKDVKIEVKKDDWTVRSGNIGIEFESRGKPSGIMTTKADYWCHNIGHYFVLMFPTDFLRQICDYYIKNNIGIKAMGDRDSDGKPTSKAVLIKWTDLLELFKKYEPTEK